MTSDKVTLACPHCSEPVTQLPIAARPIQEEKLACPSCKRVSTLAKLKTDDGNTFQLHVRKNSPRAHKQPYPTMLSKPVRGS